MADIRKIEAQLAEARQQTATAQRQLEDRLLENNGAEDEETTSLRAVADQHRSREASLVRVREAAQRANSAAAIEARHQESRDGVRGGPRSGTSLRQCGEGARSRARSDRRRA